MRLTIQTYLDLSNVPYLNTFDSVRDDTVGQRHYNDVDPDKALEALKRTCPSVPWDLRRVEEHLYEITIKRVFFRDLVMGTKFWHGRVAYICMPEMVIDDLITINALHRHDDGKIEAVYIRPNAEVRLIK